ncbi:SDR family NAD(P)-dependent oxidoreductase [Rhodococcus sp. MSC1_016]|uniref:SDR family NAD(P)-dependent oxidoreductase n=1 Tax=Rhodococcus sp. MSC1_016 TaxID=2909266 RepID=UPI0027E089E2|nr:SDR family oxidoreductase [Rhodococcus sp. MSC1_016]
MPASPDSRSSVTSPTRYGRAPSRSTCRDRSTRARWCTGHDGGGVGRIVNISSSSAQRGQQFMAHYVASKAGLVGFTKSLARELGPEVIRPEDIAAACSFLCTDETGYITVVGPDRGGHTSIPGRSLSRPKIIPRTGRRRGHGLGRPREP